MSALPPRDPPDAGTPPGAELSAPPPDVRRLLERHGGRLDHYFDAQRLRAARASHDDWPALWRLAAMDR